jgi:hypothetical protein
MSATTIWGEKCPRTMSLRNLIQGYFVPILVDPSHSCNVIAITIANKLCNSSLLSPYLLLHMATWIFLGLVLQGILHLLLGQMSCRCLSGANFNQLIVLPARVCYRRCGHVPRVQPPTSTYECQILVTMQLCSYWTFLLLVQFLQSFRESSHSSQKRN